MRFISMPDHAPLVPEPPYIYKGMRKLAVVCECSAAAIRKVVPYPLQPVGNRYEIFFFSAPVVTLGPYKSAGVYLRVKYKDIMGYYAPYLFVTSEVSLTAGREVYGMGKKLGAVKITERGNKIQGSCIRNGTELISIKADLTGDDVETLPPGGRLMLKIIPSVDCRGFDARQVTSCAAETKILSIKTGKASISLGSLKSDPIIRLKPNRILGAVFTILNFTIPKGEILANLVEKDR